MQERGCRGGRGNRQRGKGEADHSREGKGIQVGDAQHAVPAGVPRVQGSL